MTVPFDEEWIELICASTQSKIARLAVMDSTGQTYFSLPDELSETDPAGEATD